MPRLKVFARELVDWSVEVTDIETMFQTFRIGVNIGSSDKIVIQSALRAAGFYDVRWSRVGSGIGQIAVTLDNGGGMIIRKVGL